MTQSDVHLSLNYLLLTCKKESRHLIMVARACFLSVNFGFEKATITTISNK